MIEVWKHQLEIVTNIVRIYEKDYWGHRSKELIEKKEIRNDSDIHIYFDVKECN